MADEGKAGSAEVEAYRFEDGGRIPNNPALPLLLYRAAIRPGEDAVARFEALFAANGWGGGWRDGIYAYHHFHSNAHEVLGIARGEARVRLGGEGGATVAVRAGDVIVIPAGVGHKNEGASDDLLVVGAYPGGRQPDLRTGEPGERSEVLENIRKVPLPDADPIHGADGPLLQHWRKAPAGMRQA